jgi:hypothetical protein
MLNTSFAELIIEEAEIITVIRIIIYDTLFLLNAYMETEIETRFKNE